MDNLDKSNEKRENLDTPDEISPENKNAPEPPEQTTKFYTEKKFWITYGLTFGIYILIFLIEIALEKSIGLISLLLPIPYAIAGSIAFAVMINKNRRIALGLLLGGISPFVIFFVLTGGCGLVPGLMFFRHSRTCYCL